MQMLALRPKAPATIPRSHPLSAGAVREADIMVRSVMSVRIVPNPPFYFHLEFLSAQMSTETPPWGVFACLDSKKAASEPRFPILHVLLFSANSLLLLISIYSIIPIERGAEYHVLIGGLRQGYLHPERSPLVCGHDSAWWKPTCHGRWAVSPASLSLST